MKRSGTILILAFCLFSCSQYTEPGLEQDEEIVSPEIQKKLENYTPINYEREIIPFIPKGYAILDSISGDLNNDGLSDRLLVLKKRNEKVTSNVVKHPEKRPLLILIRNKQQQLELAKRNDEIIMCVDCGGQMGDPYQQLVIEKGAFTIMQAGGSSWRWNNTLIFKYHPQKKDWHFDQEINESFHTSDFESVRKTVITAQETGTIPFSKFNPADLNEQ